MDLPHPPLSRLLCAEPLEGRWLLSAPVDAAPVGAADGAGVGTVVETIEIEEEEEEGADGDVIIPQSDLPRRVSDAFFAAFPGADVTEVEQELEGTTTQYGITANHDGGKIDVTLSPGGTILETEQFISTAAVPPAVLDRLREAFPDATIDEAAIATEQGVESYEIAFVAGGKAYEGVWRIAHAPPESPPPADGGGGGDDDGGGAAERPPPAQGPARPSMVSPGSVAGASEGRAAPSESETAQRADRATRRRDPDVRDDRSTPRAPAPEIAREPDEAETVTWAALIPTNPTSRLARALNALADGEGATVWLPQVADVLSDVLPANLAGIDRGLRDVLAEIDALAEATLDGTATATPASRLAAPQFAVAAALIAGAQLLLLRYKRCNGGPVIVLNRANSSWSWLLGTATPNRPSRSFFRP